jgi:broad specificity phosphatase PhoE
MTPFPRKTALKTLLAAILVSLTLPAFAQKAIVVVRHAEKADQSKDPVLSAEGTARANALAQSLRGMDVKEVYVTQYQRTPLTAAPLMAAKGLKPVVVQAEASAELVERIRKEHPKDAVVVVGHSNTVPQILKLLGVTETIEIPDSEYDNLFLVVPAASGPPTLLRLKY